MNFRNGDGAHLDADDVGGGGESDRVKRKRKTQRSTHGGVNE
jgi:hypothetical protein